MKKQKSVSPSTYVAILSLSQATGPQYDGKPWPIGIRHPDRKTQAVAEIALADGGLASSGNYERCLQIGDRRYGHIINPKTGWPTTGPVAVTVLADQCLVAGSAATIAMLKPLPEALAWLEQLGLPWLAIDAQLQCHGRITAR